MVNYPFPEDFLFGTATASYQIEGHPLADGASPSVWHDFSHRRGKTHNGDTGDIACDFYHRYPEDIKNMKEIGCNTFRFSVAWPRIVPEPGKTNQKGIDFYSRVVDELLKNDIQPMCTLFHWDAPTWLAEKGGFTKRESVDHIRDYSETMYRALGDRVKMWVTINEPMVYAVYGYFLGISPPGRKLRIRQYFHVAHHLLLAHAEMCRAFRAESVNGKVGISENQVWIWPTRQDHEKDKAAANRMDAIVNRMYIDPLFFGTYPEEVLKIAGKKFPKGFEKDLTDMKEPGDFVGINYYMRQRYTHAPFVPLMKAKLKSKKKPELKEERSVMWEIYSSGLLSLLNRLKNEYGNPECYITENGYPLPEEDGPIYEDDERIKYLRDHLREVSRAIEQGVNVKGFYVWSLMDNFEWAFGNKMRFGLIRTDFKTLERKWKKSAAWYKDVIKNGAV